MYYEHYSVTLERWQAYEAACLDRMVKTSTELVGFQYAKVGSEMHITLVWRI